MVKLNSEIRKEKQFDTWVFTNDVLAQNSIATYTNYDILTFFHII